MAYITTPGFAGVDLTEVSSGAVVPIGTEVQASDGNTWKYVKVKNTAESGEAHIIDENGNCSVYMSTSNVGAIPSIIAYTQHAITDEYYSWVAVKGINFLCQGNHAAGDTKVFSSSSNATRLDDDAGSDILVQGMRPNAAGAATTDISGSSAGYSEVNAQD